MFNKSIVKKIKNYLKIRKQFGELYLTIRSKVDTLKDYGLQSVRPLNLLKSSYPINIVSKEDGILIKCEDDATRYWTTDDKETIFISMGKGVYKKTKNKPLEEDNENLYIVKSPMVGTFYSSPSPDKDAFVRVGDKVNASSILCIIEAMKLMNEIESEVNGTIKEILVKDGEMVEYGQPLFKIKED